MRKFGLCLTLVVAACNMSGSKPDVCPGPQVYTHKLILLDPGRYEDEISLQLSKVGFEAKSVAVAENITALKDDQHIAEYQQAGYHYGIRFKLVDKPDWQCGDSAAPFLQATMIVVDIQTDAVVAIVRQDGPYSACPPLQPVWESLAQHLAGILEPEGHMAGQQKRGA
jgi:hypothetical protein